MTEIHYYSVNQAIPLPIRRRALHLSNKRDITHRTKIHSHLIPTPLILRCKNQNLSEEVLSLIRNKTSIKPNTKQRCAKIGLRTATVDIKMNASLPTARKKCKRMKNQLANLKATKTKTAKRFTRIKLVLMEFAAYFDMSTATLIRLNAMRILSNCTPMKAYFQTVLTRKNLSILTITE